MLNEKDRRGHVRCEVRLRVFLQLSEEEEALLYTRDFSSGGAFLECPSFLSGVLEAGTRVRLRWFQDRRSVDGYAVIPARVVRTARGGIAVQFDHEVVNQFAA